MFGHLNNKQQFLVLVRALAIVVLKISKTIFSTTTHKKEGCNSRAKSNIFTFIAKMHSYIWLCIVAKSLKKKKN